MRAISPGHAFAWCNAGAVHQAMHSTEVRLRGFNRTDTVLFTCYVCRDEYGFLAELMCEGGSCSIGIGKDNKTTAFHNHLRGRGT